MSPPTVTLPTRERLLAAAEDLMAERPAHELTVRDITARAGTNVAAIGYHFGSREDLLLEALRRVLVRVTEERRAAIDALPAEAGLDEVVRAWLAPSLDALTAQGDHGASWRVLARAFHSAGPLLARLADEMRPDLEETLRGRLATLLPHLDPAELAWRQGATIGLAGFLGSSGAALLSADPDAIAPDRFVSYVAGALRAPATTGRPDADLT